MNFLDPAILARSTIPHFDGSVRNKALPVGDNVTPQEMVYSFSQQNKIRYQNLGPVLLNEMEMKGSLHN